MARSSSYNWSIDGDTIIYQALRTINAIGDGQTPSATKLSQARQILNMMIKVWQASGIGLWKNEEVVLIPQADQVQYYLGPTMQTGYGCYASLKDDFVKTELATAMTTGSTTCVVDSATGISSGYAIGIETNNGDIHWDAIDSLVDTTLTLVTGIDYAASVDNHVYVSSSWNIQRPLELIQAWINDQDDQDVPLDIISMQEYRGLANKTNEGITTTIGFDPKLDIARVYLWPEPDDMKRTIKMVIKYPIQDFDAATDNADFPVEWTEAIVYNLAIRLAAEYGRTPSQLVTALALSSYEDLKGFDREQVSLKFKPRTRDYRERY